MELEFGGEEREILSSYLRAVIEVNRKVNLTRIDSFEDGMLLHVEDSLAAVPEVEAAPDGLYGDLGSGGGFPGVPLAVVTGRQTVLVDARKKKMDVVREIIGQLGLDGQIETYAGRAELLARSRKGEFSVLTARALSQLSVLMELSSPLLKNGGRLVCYKAHVSDEELEHAREVESLVGMKLCSDREFLLGGEYQRRILVFEKVGKAGMKLPRLEGVAQREPI